MKVYYTCDFETRSGPQCIADNLTYVWAWCMKKLGEPEIWYGSTIAEFFERVNKNGGGYYYFHNLKFDGSFIIDFLMKNGFQYTNNRNPEPHEFSTVITEDGLWYAIVVKISKTKRCTFLDSFKKIPFKVDKIAKDFGTKAQKLRIDYEFERPEGYQMSEEEREYIRNDVLIVDEVLARMHGEGLDHMTIGSDCLNYFFKTYPGGKSMFRDQFPALGLQEDDFIRKAYKGGWCYLKSPGCYKGVDGKTFDVNSLYPYVMHSKSGCKLPNCRGIYYKGLYQKDRRCSLFVQHFACCFDLKPGRLPCIQVKGHPLINENEWLKSSEIVIHKENGETFRINEPIELWLSSVDLEMFFDNYDILTEPEWIDGYKYNTVDVPPFDDYIDHWMTVKKTSKGAQRSLAKLMLNNLGGKFGMRRRQCDKIPNLNDSGRVTFKSSDEYEKAGLYLPIAVFMTAYARRYTIQAAQENYDSFIYADTDSIHIIGEPKGIKIDSSELGAWKLEREWTEGIFRKQKMYIEVDASEWRDEYESADDKDAEADTLVKCAGMPTTAKRMFIDSVIDHQRDLEDFDIGLTLERSKLNPERIPGGVVLVETDFTIREWLYGYF